ncbi:MAG: sulfatase [bacterium]|nr:sulfatase [bacterium]
MPEKWRRSAGLTFLQVLCVACIAIGVTACERPGPTSDAQEGGAAQPSESESSSTQEATHAKPNVVWIVLDALRASNLSCYGYERETTPNLDRLSARGVLFEQAFSQANGTALSVPSYMTGKYFPVFCLSSGNWRQLFRTPPDDEQLAPEILRENGYVTAAITAHPWFGPESRIYAAFDECRFVPSESGKAYAELDELNQDAFAWMEAHRDEPFFLYLHTMDTHLPHYPKQGHDAWIDKEYAKNPDNAAPFSDDYRAHLLGLYDGSLHYADACIGRFLQQLDTLGLTDNTIVVIGSDHGECLGEDGQTIDHPGILTVDELFHVPLIMAGPGIPAGVRVEALAANSDIVPTLVDVLALDTSANTDGKSLAPLFRGEADALHDYVVARFPRGEDDFCHFITARTAEWKYEYYPNNDNGKLWMLPDLLGRREEVSRDNPLAAEGLQQRVKQEALPLWERYAALPRTSPRPFPLEVTPVYAAPPDAHVDEFNMRDNKWGLHYLNLISTALHEDAPPITFRFEVPNGTYRVQMELRPKDTGSAFSVMAEEDSEPTIVVSEAKDKARVFEDLGVYEITDGTFDVTLDEADNRHSARLSSFRLIPIIDGREVVSADEQDARNEQLKALGYL